MLRIILNSNLEDNVKVRVWNDNEYIEEPLYAGGKTEVSLQCANIDRLYIQCIYSYENIKNPVSRALINALWGIIYYIFKCFSFGEPESFKNEQKDRYAYAIYGDFDVDTVITCVCEENKGTDNSYRIRVVSSPEYRLERKIKVDSQEMAARLRQWKLESKIAVVPGTFVLMLCVAFGVLKKVLILSILAGIAAVFISIKFYRLLKAADRECETMCRKSQMNFPE